MEEITMQSISTLISDAMRIKNMSVEKLSTTTGVSDRFIELLLEEKFNKLPAAPYVRGYLLKIGDALSIDGNELWEIIKMHHTQTVARSGENDKPLKTNFFKGTINIKLIVGIIIIVAFVGFFLLRLPALLGKPKFELNDFQDGMRVTTSTFIIHGTINPSDEIFINDEQIVTDETGKFEKTIELTPEFNTFHFAVKGLLGKELQETRQIFFEAPKKEIKKNTNVETTTEQITE